MTTDNRHTRLLIGLGVAAAILLGKIFSIQVLDDHYKVDADINSTVKEMILPTRGSSTTGTEPSWWVTRLPTTSSLARGR